MHLIPNDSVEIAGHCARKLLQLRARTNETQKQLADRLGMTDSMISRLERGDHVPNLKTLCRIADAFGQHLEIVFHEHDDSHPDGSCQFQPQTDQISASGAADSTSISS